MLILSWLKRAAVNIGEDIHWSNSKAEGEMHEKNLYIRYERINTWP